MSLSVDLEKRLGSFHLRVQFQAEGRDHGTAGGIRLRQEHDPPNCIAGDHDPGSGADRAKRPGAV